MQTHERDRVAAHHQGKRGVAPLQHLGDAAALVMGAASVTTSHVREQLGVDAGPAQKQGSRSGKRTRATNAMVMWVALLAWLRVPTTTNSVAGATVTPPG